MTSHSKEQWLVERTASSMNPTENASYSEYQTPDWNSIAALELLTSPKLYNEKDILLNTTAGKLVLQVLANGIRLKTHKQRNFDYGLLCKQPKAQAVNLQTNAERTSVRSANLHLDIQHKPFCFKLFGPENKLLIESTTDGHFVRQHRVPPFAKTPHGWLISVALNSDEALYGLGEKWGSLNKRGQLVRSYNHDALGVNAEVSYKNVPFCWSPKGWAVFSHTPTAVTHAVGFAPWSQRSHITLVEDEYLDFFLFVDPTPTQSKNPGAYLIDAYTDLTGKAPVPPRWSGGVIMSKAYYKNADELLAVAHEIRNKQMPCDVITFDGRAWQDTDTRFAFEWCSKRYPTPKPIIDKLKSLNFKICLWEYPLISVQHRWFKEFESKGWLIKDKRTNKAYQYQWDQQAFGEVLTPLPNSGIVDFTHPYAYAFWRDSHRKLFELGIDMIKADFGEQLDDDNMFASNGDSGLALHNAYAHLYNRCVYEACEKFSSSGAFIFSRAAWIGSQRFNSQWGGDPQADWEGMMGNIRGGISWGLSGAPFYATDVGGFYKDTRNDQLYVRWAQAAIFSAHYRLHGIGAREPWSYSSAAETAVNNAIQLRYQLQSYLLNSMQQASKTGLPVQRAMVLAFPHEPQAWGFENQFMFGDDLLIAPCFKPDGSVQVYLPQGKWTRFNPNKQSNETLNGGQLIKLSLALDEIAVFAKHNAQIPINKSMQYIEESDNALPIEFYWQANLTA